MPSLVDFFFRVHYHELIDAVFHHTLVREEHAIDVLLGDGATGEVTGFFVQCSGEVKNQYPSITTGVTLEDCGGTLTSTSDQHFATMGVSRLDHLTRQHQILFMANAIEVTSAIGPLGVKRHFVQASGEERREQTMCRHENFLEKVKGRQKQ